MYTFSVPVPHTHAQHSHLIKQLTVLDSTQQKPKWIGLNGSGQIPQSIVVSQSKKEGQDFNPGVKL